MIAVAVVASLMTMMPALVAIVAVVDVHVLDRLPTGFQWFPTLAACVSLGGWWTTLSLVVTASSGKEDL